MFLDATIFLAMDFFRFLLEDFVLPLRGQRKSMLR